MIDTGIANMYYFYSIGKKAAVNSFKFTLTIPIDADVLQKAVEKTAERFYYFKLKPVLDLSGKVKFIYNNEKIEVYEDTDEVCLLGTKQSNYYLFRVNYLGKYIRINIFHGITDGRGSFSFCVSLLYNYLAGCGYEIQHEGMVLTNDMPCHVTEKSIITEDVPGEKMINKNNIHYVGERIFSIPEDNVWIDTSKTKKIKLLYNVENLKKWADENSVSFVSIISVLFTDAIRIIYKAEEKPIIVSLPIDMRKKLNSHALSNYCCYGFIEDNVDKENICLESRIVKQQKKIMEMLEFPNLRNLVNKTRLLENIIQDISIDNKYMFEESLKRRMANRKNNATYCITNVGKINIPKDIQKFIVNFDLDSPNLSPYPIICMISMDQTGYFFITQNNDDGKLVNQFRELLNKNNINTILEKEEMIQTDMVLPYLFDQEK